MKRSPSAVTLGVLAGVLVTVLSGCSLFGDSSSGKSQAIPSASVTASSAAPPGAAALVPSASLSPTVSVAADAPKPPSVPGYSLVAPKDSVHRKFQVVAGQFKGVFAGITSRTVVKGQTQVGSLVLLGLHPDLVGNTQVEQRLVPGMVKGMSGQGAKVTQQKVGAQNLVVATTKSTNIIAWYHSGTVVLVLGNGTSPAQSLTFAKAYLAAA